MESSFFDKIIDRTQTQSYKYDYAIENGKPADILPLWVADMDFQGPPAVLEALHRAVDHGIFGYSETGEEYFQAVHNWFLKRFGWDTKREWLVKTPCVVYAFSAVVRAYTNEGDAVLIQQPVYYPFSNAILENDRKLINSPLHYEDGVYSIDFSDFEQKIVENRVKLFILCSPHNPVGRVWTKEELIRMADICQKHGVLVVSDEIHADFTYPGFQHTVYATLGEEYAQNCIVCTAPSKTFNLAGLQCSNIFIPNPELREKFLKEMRRTGYGMLNQLGLVACRAAYERGGKWLETLKSYLIGNLEYVRSFLAEELPQIRLVEPQGTYLVWLDCRGLGLPEEQLEDLMVNRAKLWLDAGAIFGVDGEGFERINLACPRATIERAMRQLKEAVSAL